jgi:hypothetical protein
MAAQDVIAPDPARDHFLRAASCPASPGAGDCELGHIAIDATAALGSEHKWSGYFHSCA